MDIQLSDGLSFNIFKAANITCPVIFTTAYDKYLTQAFEYSSIDQPALTTTSTSGEISEVEDFATPGVKHVFLSTE